MNNLMSQIKQSTKRTSAHITAWFSKSFHRLMVALKDEHSMLRYIIYLTLVGICFYGVALISNLFTIPLSGDYVLQQIPFYFNGYDDWWHFIKTGEFVLWDSSTYLGVNNIGSNSFYYYLNPFFIPIILFPRALVPQGLAILMITKNVLAGLAMRLYLRYFGVSEKSARLFGLVYAYCGWITYYLWFNHFMEVAVVFPLIFLGIEKLLKDKRPWFLIFALFLMGLTNYFFLVTAAMVGVIYALFRYFQVAPKKSWKDRLITAPLGVFAFATGIMMSAFVFWPSIIVATMSDRAVNASYLERLLAVIEVKNWDVVYEYVTAWSSPYKKLYPLITFFFPTVSNRSSTLLRTSAYDNTISSLFIYTPIMLLFIPSLIHSLRKKKFSHLIPLLFFSFALFTPFFYQLFHGFTVDYGRWQIFVVVSLIAYIAINFEERHEFKRWYYDVSGAVVLVMAALTFYQASQFQYKYGFSALEERLYIGIYQLAVIVAAYIIMRVHARRQIFTKYLTWFVTLEAIVMGAMTMSMQGLIFYVNDYDSGLEIVNDERAIIKKITTDDQSFYRIYNLNAGESSNINMRLGYNGLGAFHSLYNFYTTEFNEWSHMNYNHNGWSLGYHEKRYNLDLFLNIKYYMLKNEYDSWTSQIGEDGRRNFLYQNVPHGFIKMDEYTTDLHTVYMNTNYIEGGFSYDTLIDTNYNETTGRSDFYVNTTTEVLANEEAYLRGAILRNTDVDEVLSGAPNLARISRPNRNIQYQSTDVTLITCPIEQGEYIDPLRTDGYIGCSRRLIYVNSKIAGYVGHRSAIMIEPNDGPYFGTEDQDYFYALELRLTHHATVYLLNQANEIIVRDAHSFVTSSFKHMRGFYADEPVAKIMIIPKNVTTFDIDYPRLYGEPYGNFLTRHDDLAAYPLENFAYSANRQTFTTNFNEARFIVLTTPYDPGWSIKAISGDGVTTTPKVYKAQGGFVGFLSEVGQTEYIVSYWTPYLTEGLLISLAGFALFGGSWAAVYLVTTLRQKREDDPALPLDATT